MARRTISGTALAELIQPASGAGLIGPANSAGLRSASGAGLIRPASGADEAGAHRILPVLPELSRLLPHRGLRRGSTVAVATGPSAPASGGTSLLLALLA